MNLDFDEKKFSCKYFYCIGKITDLADPSLHIKSQEYKRRVSGATKPLSGEDAFKIPKAKGYFVSRKYDGEMAMVFFDGKKIISVNPGGTRLSAGSKTSCRIAVCAAAALANAA